MTQSPSIVADPQAALAEAMAAQAALQEEIQDALRAEQEQASMRVQHLGSMLQKQMDERVSLRSEIEQRWLKNIRQVNGIYESEDMPVKKPGEYGSSIYVPLTRRLRNLAEARLCDVLFPSDNRSWVLSPSPIAELSEAGSAIAGEDPDAQVPGMPEGTKLSDIMAAIKGVQKEAEIKASRMERTVDDRLAECRWPAKARRAISDAIDFGTGVIKGPVAARRSVRRWTVDPATGNMVPTVRDDVVPVAHYVPLWNFFPDMSATEIDDCVDIGELHPMSRKELQALRMEPGFNSAAIDMILRSEPRSDNSTRRQELRAIAGVSSASDPRYLVWEYHGPIRGRDLNACSYYERMHAAGEEGDESGAPEEYDEDEDYSAVVWFCDGIVIKAIVQPLDSNQPHIYSVIWWQRDKASIFGYGLPDEVRDQQSSANGSFRAMLDNMGLTVGPQIVFDDEIIKPVDGTYSMRPFKMWKKTNPTADVRQAFAFFQTDSRITELGQVFDKSKMLMDEIATLPAFMQGQEQPVHLQSATAASLAYTASTLWVRRVVRHWDDNIIEPMMGRFVDWEMDFNPDESIKGDFKPIAKGIGSLVELEGQGQRMTAFLQTAQSMGVPPRDQMRMLRQFARSLKLDPDEILPTEEEIQQMPQQAPDPNAMKVQAAEENSKRIHEAKMALVSMKGAELEARADELARREKLALLEIASRERISLEDAAQKYNYNLASLDAEMADNEAQRRHEAQMQNSETALKLRTGSGL